MKNYNTNSGAASHWRMISCGDNNHRSAIYTCFMTDFKTHQKNFLLQPVDMARSPAPPGSIHQIQSRNIHYLSIIKVIINHYLYIHI